MALRFCEGGRGNRGSHLAHAASRGHVVALARGVSTPSSCPPLPAALDILEVRQKPILMT